MKHTITFDVGEERPRFGGKSTVSIDGVGAFPIEAVTFDDQHGNNEKARELLEQVRDVLDDCDDILLDESTINKLQEAINLI